VGRKPTPSSEWFLKGPHLISPFTPWAACSPHLLLSDSYNNYTKVKVVSESPCEVWLVSPAQRKWIPKGPRPSAAWLHQGNYTFFGDVILMADPLHFDHALVGRHFCWLFFPSLFSQEQVAICYLDARNFFSSIEYDKAWVIVEQFCVKFIDEVKGAEDAHTHYHTDDDKSYFMSTAAAVLTTVTPFHLTSVEIARREIQVWKSLTLSLPKTSNPLEWRRRGGVQIFPCLSLLPGVCWWFLPHGGASDIVKAESSWEDPRATKGLVFNFPDPRVNKTKKHICITWALFHSSIS